MKNSDKFDINQKTAFKKFFKLSLFGAFVLLAAGLLFASQRTLLFVLTYTSAVASIVFYALYKSKSYKDEMDRCNQGVNELDKTLAGMTSQNESLHAIHEVTMQLSMAQSKAVVFNCVTKGLVHSFKYDLSQFWLIEKDSVFECQSRVGSDQIVKKYQDESYDNCFRKFLESFIGKNETVIFNNGVESNTEVGIDTSKFCICFKLSSMVVSPIYHDNKMIGVLTAEYHHGQQMDTHDREIVESVSSATYAALAHQEMRLLDEKDRVLVNSISSLVNDALVKIELFQDMEKKIEERTRELLRTHEELTLAREMIIQSEKLSSLGRMAAGVIHQIKDSLNFLVNIIPDLKKDMEGLQKIYENSKVKMKDTDSWAEFKAIAKDYDLDNHLEDAEFIFTRTKKALGKSKDIANSLKVFTNSSPVNDVVIADLFPLIQNTIDLIPKKTKGQTVINLHADKKLCWKINANRMEQVFVNLINNAIDAMDGKGVIDITGEETPKGDVLIRISDNGPGIPDEIQKKVFDPFYTTKPAGKSTGLGLSISAEIVRRFGGQLSVESKPGEGACFTIMFSQLAAPVLSSS